jgi:predicted nucleic acid-binding protein
MSDPAEGARRFVLDTSALLAWIGGEPGSDRVRALLRGPEEVLLPWPVLLEMYYVTARLSGDAKALQRYAAVRQLPVTFHDRMDEPLLLAAARLKARYPISLADALIAAHALAWDAVLVHKDPEYEALAAEIALEALPFKQRG